MECRSKNERCLSPPKNKAANWAKKQSRKKAGWFDLVVVGERTKKRKISKRGVGQQRRQKTRSGRTRARGSLGLFFLESGPGCPAIFCD